ncbi:MAG: hypothetical protein AAFQ64_18825 [Pseudomonadota bacterium]
MNNPSDPAVRAQLLADLVRFYERFGQQDKAADIAALARFIAAEPNGAAENLSAQSDGGVSQRAAE